MGLRGDACIVGIAERPSERKFARRTHAHDRAVGRSLRRALADAGIEAARSQRPRVRRRHRRVVDVPSGDHRRVLRMVGRLRRARRPRRRVGGRHGVAGGRRDRARHVRRGRACATVGRRGPIRRSRRPRARARRVGRVELGSTARRKPSSKCPYGDVAQNIGFAMYAQRYHDALRLGRAGRGPRSRPTSARARAPTPTAVFFGKPITTDDVLESPHDRRPAAHLSRS